MFWHHIILIGFILLRFLDIDYIRYSRVKKRETRMHIKYQTYIYVYFSHQLWNNRCCMKTTTSTQSYTFLRLPNFVQILNYQAPPQTFHLLPINIWNLKVKILERYLSKFILKKPWEIRISKFSPGDLIAFNSDVSK